MKINKIHMENEDRVIPNPNQNEKKLTVKIAEEILDFLLDNTTTLENKVSLLIDKIIIPTQDELDVLFWRDIKKEVLNLMEKK